MTFKKADEPKKVYSVRIRPSDRKKIKERGLVLSEIIDHAIAQALATDAEENPSAMIPAKERLKKAKDLRAIASKRSKTSKN